ncbi:hypothetical protein Hbl1158_02800 [Halobaculum sp. CBA1158]|uniref:hypothetical protein n=1 Tax=Halobaculum sp. CBA1158 TaxID=2904243 RepID=UPI001F305CA9|nr:hypothetical protein [Halobaculum sp. CBA1158]UIP00316.1 hypothetical protein Hbl1158_02800 [Halobaculum sp. CBA1158]
MKKPAGPSPLDPDTYYHIEVSHTPVTVDGIARGEPTGWICCGICHGRGRGIDDIDHNQVDGDRCRQAYAHTLYWRYQVLGAEWDEFESLISTNS